MFRLWRMEAWREWDTCIFGDNSDDDYSLEIFFGFSIASEMGRDTLREKDEDLTRTRRSDLFLFYEMLFPNINFTF